MAGLEQPPSKTDSGGGMGKRNTKRFIRPLVINLTALIVFMCTSSVSLFKIYLSPYLASTTTTQYMTDTHDIHVKDTPTQQNNIVDQHIEQHVLQPVSAESEDNEKDDDESFDEEDTNTEEDLGWKAMKKVPRKQRWGLQHTKVLKSITLPLWIDAPTEASEENDRLGNVWLPPRLRIASDIQTLKYGVLFCAIGKDTFAKEQVVPMIRHLHENLGIPDAQGRAELREKGVSSLESDQGFALVTARQFVGGPLKDWVSFFDAIYLTEDLPAYPFDWQNKTSSRAMIKATKVHVMASAPFDTTIMLDLDSFPCTKGFALPLLEAFQNQNSDIGFTNIVDEMDVVTDSRHFLGEHNSAVVVLNMKSIRTRLLMVLYIQAYHRTGEISKSGRQRDQPSLAVAMQSMAEEFIPAEGQPSEIPNDSARQVIDEHKLGFIQHVDFGSSHVCRGRTTGSKNVICGEDSSCLIAHKGKGLYKSKATWGGGENDGEPIKLFGIGFKKTGTTSLDTMFSHLIDKLGGSRPSGKERTRALNDLLIGDGGNSTISSALALAEKHTFFQDAPWCNEPARLYRQLATLHPNARFILTIREPEEWYQSVVNWVQCRPTTKKKGRCGNKKIDRYKSIFGANSTSRDDFVSAYVNHNEAARQYFVEELKQPQRFLEIDLTDTKYNGGVGWAIFCDFAGLSKELCQSGDIPHVNSRYPLAKS